MVKIIINNNNMFQLEGNLKVLNKLQKKYMLKHPGAFFLRKSGVMGKNWDGHVHYITEGAKFKPGLFTEIVKDITETYDEKLQVEDNRKDFGIVPTMPDRIGTHEFRGYQYNAVNSVITNTVAGIPHYVGVLDAATNAGKTTMMAAIHLAFKSKIPTIVLLKDGDLFEQFRKELPHLIDDWQLGFVRGKEINFNNFTVVMVQTLSPKVKEYVNALSKFGICLVDEADEGDSKSYRNIITRLYNCKVRVGLSGTIYMSKLKKDDMKNRNLKTFFGEVLFKITKKEMTDLGYSTKVVVKLHKGSDYPPVVGYPEEYSANISNNKHRARKGADLMLRAIKFKRLPAIVIYRFHEHGKMLLKVFRKKITNNRIELVHGSTKNRKKLLEEFRDGKIDILISSFIVKRGKNFPLIKYIQNASATDSQETVSQIMGRGERTHESKTKYYLDDFMDEGKYLKRHSKHRKQYYKAEGFTVIEK